jgi:hypothetical protein
MQQSLPTRVIQMPMAIGALYVVYIGLGCNIDQIDITISFYTINLKLKYVSLLDG